MTRPLVTVVVLTIGRATLEAALASVRGQAPPAECEILVVGDTHARTFAPSLAWARRLCDDMRIEYLPFDGGLHHYGCPQRTYGQRCADGAWLAYLQDDAAWRSGAWAAIQASIAAAPPGPRLFQVRTWQPPRAAAGVDPWQTIWREPVLREANIDGDALLVPNVPDQLAPWPATRYESDFDAIAATVALWQGQVRWEPFVLVEGTPHVSASVAVPA